MKKIYCLCLACLLVSVMAAQSVKELYIFHTNDMHSRIEPFASYFPDTVLAGKAGVLRRAAFVKNSVVNTKICCCSIPVISLRKSLL